MGLTNDEIAATRRYMLDQGAGAFWAVAHGISAETGISVDEIRGPSRKADACRARELVCYFAAKRGVGVTVMGRLLSRDHATIAHSIRNAGKKLGPIHAEA